MSEVAKIPGAVVSRVIANLSILRQIASGLESGRQADRMFSGQGRYEVDAWQNLRPESCLAFFRQFETLASANNINASAVYEELGGKPDVSLSTDAQEWITQ